MSSYIVVLLKRTYNSGLKPAVVSNFSALVS